MHPTLLIGPADWNPQRMPLAEFRARLDAMWRAVPEAMGAIVYGDSHDHAALAYLTNFTPKLEPGVALLARSGEAKLLVGGGINMLPAAKPLTWVEDLLPLRALGKTVADWCTAQPEGQVILIGGGAMPFGMRGDLERAIGHRALGNGDEAARALMRCKSAREMESVREACAALARAVSAIMRARGEGLGVTDTVLAGEHAAYQAGAQDVRSLFSLDRGRTLQPFEVPVASSPAVLPLYVAVRCSGCWAERFLTLTGGACASVARAQAALRAAIEKVRAGASYRLLTDAVAAGLRPDSLHPVIADDPVVPLGLSLSDMPDADATLRAGEVISIRAGTIHAGEAALISAMVAVGDDGAELLSQDPAA